MKPFIPFSQSFSLFEQSLLQTCLRRSLRLRSGLSDLEVRGPAHGLEATEEVKSKGLKSVGAIKPDGGAEGEKAD